MKGRPQKTSTVKGGLSIADKGVFHMWTSALFGAKNFGFFEIYGESARTRGEGVNFSGFYAVVFYGWPLIILNNP